MKKGQLFILTIVLVSFVLAGLVNLTYNLNLESKASYTKISPTKAIEMNVEKELMVITNMDPENVTRLNKSIMAMKREAGTKDINLNIEWSNSSNSNNCDVWLDKSILPYNNSGNGRVFEVSIHDYGEEKVVTKFKVCWS